MKVGDYVRTETGQIGKITYFEGDMVRVDCDKFITYKSNHDEIIKSSPNILKLLEPMDLLYIDISPYDCCGIVVPRIPETQNELYKIICGIGRQEIVLKGIVTHEQLESMEYKIEED